MLMAASALWPSVAPARWTTLVKRPLADLDFTAFATYLHTPFLVRHPHGSAQWLELVRADLHLPYSGGPTGEQFSLRFGAGLTAPLGQDTYEFNHQELGTFDLFIVPMGRDAEGRFLYEAAFNRCLPPAIPALNLAAVVSTTRPPNHTHG